MSEVNLAPPCGFYCGDCHHLNNPCLGCMNNEGKPFWSTDFEGGLCPIWDCCRERKELEHCGLCPEFPCEIFLGLRDPQMSDEEFQQTIEYRQHNLSIRVLVGTEKWIADQSRGA